MIIIRANNKMVKKIKRTQWYSLIGDIYEYYGQDMNSPKRTHTDNGLRLRSKKYGCRATFANALSHESLEKRKCVLTEKRAGIYILCDAISPNGFYIGKGKCIHDRLWRHGVKLVGTAKWNQGVQDTKEFKNYRMLRSSKNLNDLNDIKVAFWFTDEIDALESLLLESYLLKYGHLPICNDKKVIIFDKSDI